MVAPDRTVFSWEAVSDPNGDVTVLTRVRGLQIALRRWAAVGPGLCLGFHLVKTSNHRFDISKVPILAIDDQKIDLSLYQRLGSSQEIHLFRLTFSDDEIAPLARHLALGSIARLKAILADGEEEEWVISLDGASAAIAAAIGPTANQA